MQGAEQVMALVIAPLNSLAFPSIPHRKKKMLRNGTMRKKSTGWHEKEEKVLTLEAPQWKFMKSLLMPPAMGGMQYGQKAFAGRR